MGLSLRRICSMIVLCIKRLVCAPVASDDEDAKTKRKRANKEAKRDAKSNAAAQQAVGAEVRDGVLPFFFFFIVSFCLCDMSTGR